MKILNWLFSSLFIPVEEAAHVASHALHKAQSDWTKLSPTRLCTDCHSEIPEDLYLLNAMCLNTLTKPGQPALFPILLFHRVNGKLTRIRRSNAGSFRCSFYSKFVYLDDWHREYQDVFMRRRDLHNWIGLASRWQYLKESA